MSSPSPAAPSYKPAAIEQPLYSNSRESSYLGQQMMHSMSPAAATRPVLPSPVILPDSAASPHAANVQHPAYGSRIVSGGSHSPHAAQVQSRSAVDRAPIAASAVVSNQYYVPQGEDVRQVPLGGVPSLGMTATYPTDRVRTFESRMFYDNNPSRVPKQPLEHIQKHKHAHRESHYPGRHCSKCDHSASYSDGDYSSQFSDSDSTAVSARGRSSNKRHRGRRPQRVSCRECLKEMESKRRAGRHGHSEVSKHRGGKPRGRERSKKPSERGSRRRSKSHRHTKASSKRRHASSGSYPSDGPDYLRDRHHQRTYRGPRHSSDALSSSRHRSGRSAPQRHSRRRDLSSSLSTSASSRSRSSSLVVVIGHKVAAADLDYLKGSLRRKVESQLPNDGFRRRHRSTHRSDKPKHHITKRRARRRSLSASSSSSVSSSSDSLCSYHAGLRKQRPAQKKHKSRPKHHPQHQVRQRDVQSIPSDDESSEARYFEPQTTHHYFHHYPELPSRKPNPFPSNSGTPLKRHGEEQAPGVATMHHYPISEKQAAKYKSGYPANPSTAKQPFDRLKISTFEFEQPQDPEYVGKN